MIAPHAGHPYSFSMINLVRLMPDWCWNCFDQVMAKASTARVELVPSMALGVDWDHQIETHGGPAQHALDHLLERYAVGSIQSLTYGLKINLADDLINHTAMIRRLHGLQILGTRTQCSVLILGSPGQKKLLDPAISASVHKQRFTSNCSWIANMVGPDLILSLEHNTREQGAEYCNTFVDIVDVVKTIRSAGTANVGINLDTKCLIHEFGAHVNVGELLADTDLIDLITSIQVSYDFLTRDSPHRTEDQRQLLAFARTRALPLSLEEFGLLENQVQPFVEAWNSQL